MAANRTDSCKTCYFYDWDRTPGGSLGAVVVTIAIPGVISAPGNGRSLNEPVVFSTTGALPTGLTTQTVYYAIPIDADNFSVAASKNGTAINTTGTQSGTHSCDVVINTCHVDAPSPPLAQPTDTTLLYKSKWQPVDPDYWCGHFSLNNPNIYAVASGAGYKATSTTSLATAGSGSKAFTTQSGLAYSVGARIRATSVGTAEWMEGVVTAYVETAPTAVLTVTMDTNSGTGTHTDWNINLAGQFGSSGGAMAYLATLTASASASLSDTTHITASYDFYVIQVENLIPAVAGGYLIVQVTTDGGSTWKTTSYTNVAGSTDGIYLAGAGAGYIDTVAPGLCGTLYLGGPNRTDNNKVITGITSYYDGNAAAQVIKEVAGQWTGATTAINGLKFSNTVGNLQSGKIRIYGIATS